MRRTKILATVGPATFSPAGVRGLLEAGADALRVNFSHGTEAEHRAVLRRIHLVSRRLRREIAVVADLQGPKIRIGELQGGTAILEEGAPWSLDANPAPGNFERVPVEVPHLPTAARAGDPVLLGDGAVELVVESVSETAIACRVVHGGSVASHAGLFLPKAHLRTSILGPKDRADLRLALGEGVDYVALSFVRSERDVLKARELLRGLGAREVGLLAKIERAEALPRIDAILEAADAIMVARGDLGIEVPLERLALEQKRMVARANAHGKPAVVATQMLLSMMHAPRPTRAEATDVANAVLDGADALMLSEESAVGPFAVEAVRWLDRIARSTEEAAVLQEVAIHPTLPVAREGSEWAVASAAVHLAREIGARAIVTPTHSGRTAGLVAAKRPECPVVALSSVAATRRRLALLWGVVARPSPKHLNLLQLRELASRESRPFAARREQPAVLTAGFPVEGRPTNLVTVVDAD